MFYGKTIGNNSFYVEGVTAVTVADDAIVVVVIVTVILVLDTALSFSNCSSANPQLNSLAAAQQTPECDIVCISIRLANVLLTGVHDIDTAHIFTLVL